MVHGRRRALDGVNKGKTLSYFLDTNVWSTLARKELSEIAVKLRRLNETHRIRVLGSGELLEEFAGVGGREQHHFASMLDLFWTCTNGDLYRPHSELVRAEVRKGSRLTLEETLLDREIVAELRECDSGQEIWHDVAVGVQNQKSEHATKMIKTNQEFAEAVANLDTERETRRASRELPVDKDQINTWFRSFCTTYWSDLGLAKDPKTWPRGSALPAVSVQFAFFIALAKSAHADGRLARPSDLHDVIHCVHSAYSDCFVTFDRKLVVTAKQIDWPRLSIIQGEDFVKCIDESV